MTTPFNPTITIEIEPDDMPYKGNCSAIDEATDKRTEQWIKRQLAAGNLWAWCQVKVTATQAGLEGTNYLGGCSYKSEAAFKQTGGYYDDMVNNATEELRQKLIAAQEIEL